MSDGSILWAFRVASRPEVGGGHVARGLTLARALTDLGDRVLFVLDDNDHRWQRSILEQGHGCISASSSLPESIAGCLIDGYDFDARSIQTWREKIAVMVAIIDHQPRPEWADLTIAPALSPAQAEKSAPAILAGLNYALVDPRFVHTTSRKIPEKIGNVLVSFGQRDSRNATALALGALAQLQDVRFGTMSITIALGGSALHVPEITDRTARIDGASCKIDADMAKCYAAADFVIGGGGVGLLERMAQGLPSVSVSLADNQRRQIALCAEAGGTLDAGRFEDLDPARFAETLSSLMQSHGRRLAMSANARRVVDGLGAKRCAHAMHERVRFH